TDQLRSTLGLWQGECLEGFELPDSHRFHNWCHAEREEVSRLHLTLRRALLGRLRDPEEALLHARVLAVADPLAEDGHATIVRLLGQLGRRREALAWYDHAHRLLRAELGPVRSVALDQARYRLGLAPAVSQVAWPATPLPTD